MIVLHARRQELEDRHARDRAIMVAHHLEARGIADLLVLAAMGEVPREAFVSEPLEEFASEDSAPPHRGRADYLTEANMDQKHEDDRHEVVEFGEDGRQCVEIASISRASGVLTRAWFDETFNGPSAQRGRI
jgi:hypothetical protein